VDLLLEALVEQPMILFTGIQSSFHIPPVHSEHFLKRFLLVDGL